MNGHTQDTSSKIDRLPKWAKELISSLNRQLSDARKELSLLLGRQEETPFYTEDFNSSLGESPNIVKRYLPVGNSVTVEHEGVRLVILLPKGVQGRRGIELSWSATEEIQAKGVMEVVFAPTAMQKAVLRIPSLGYKDIK